MNEFWYSKTITRSYHYTFNSHIISNTILTLQSKFSCLNFIKINLILVFLPVFIHIIL